MTPTSLDDGADGDSVRTGLAGFAGLTGATSEDESGDEGPESRTPSVATVPEAVAAPKPTGAVTPPFKLPQSRAPRRPAASGGSLFPTRPQVRATCGQVLLVLVQNANWMERCTILCALLVLLSGLFYRTSYLELVDSDGSSVDGQTGADEVTTRADAGVKRQLLAVDVVCVSISVLSAVYMVVMSVVPLVRSVRRQGGRGARVRGAGV